MRASRGPTREHPQDHRGQARPRPVQPGKGTPPSPPRGFRGKGGRPASSSSAHHPQGARRGGWELQFYPGGTPWARAPPGQVRRFPWRRGRGERRRPLGGVPKETEPPPVAKETELNGRGGRKRRGQRRRFCWGGLQKKPPLQSNAPPAGRGLRPSLQRPPRPPTRKPAEPPPRPHRPCPPRRAPAVVEAPPPPSSRWQPCREEALPGRRRAPRKRLGRLLFPWQPPPPPQHPG